MERRLRNLSAHVAAAGAGQHQGDDGSTNAGRSASAVPDHGEDDRAVRYTAGTVASDMENHKRLHQQFRENGRLPLAKEEFFEFPSGGLFIDDCALDNP